MLYHQLLLISNHIKVEWLNFSFLGTFLKDLKPSLIYICKSHCSIPINTCLNILIWYIVPRKRCPQNNNTKIMLWLMKRPIFCINQVVLSHFSHLMRYYNALKLNHECKINQNQLACLDFLIKSEILLRVWNEIVEYKNFSIT